MDAVLSTNCDFPRMQFTSSVKSAVKEYEQKINELEKEIFDLKLRLFVCEGPLKTNYFQIEASGIKKQDSSGKITAELKVHDEIFKNELGCKSKLPQKNSYIRELDKCDLDYKQSKCVELKEQVSSFLPRTTEQHKVENQGLHKSNKYFTQVLAEKDKKIDFLNGQVEELLRKNKTLKSRIEKTSLDIRLMSKYCKGLQLFIQSPDQTAKKNITEDLSSRTPNEAKNNIALQKNSSEILRKLVEINETSESLSQSSKLNLPKSKLHSGERKSERKHDLELLSDIVKANDFLKLDIAKKSKIIEDLCTTSSKWERKSIRLQSELKEALAKINSLVTRLKKEKSKHTISLSHKDSSAQTTAHWHFMQSKLTDVFAGTTSILSNLEDFKEEIFSSLLVIEQTIGQ